jgi:hypothetical protein
MPSIRPTSTGRWLQSAATYPPRVVSRSGSAATTPDGAGQVSLIAPETDSISTGNRQRRSHAAPPESLSRRRNASADACMLRWVSGPWPCASWSAGGLLCDTPFVCSVERSSTTPSPPTRRESSPSGRRCSPHDRARSCRRHRYDHGLHGVRPRPHHLRCSSSSMLSLPRGAVTSTNSSCSRPISPPVSTGPPTDQPLPPTGSLLSRTSKPAPPANGSESAACCVPRASADAFEHARISYAKVRTLARELARWLHRPQTPEAIEAHQQRRRSLTWRNDPEGTVTCTARLPAGRRTVPRRTRHPGHDLPPQGRARPMADRRPASPNASWNTSPLTPSSEHSCMTPRVDPSTRPAASATPPPARNASSKNATASASTAAATTFSSGTGERAALRQGRR